MFEYFKKDKALEVANHRVRKLLSAQGEVNAQSMALKIIESYRDFNPAQRQAFFDFLANQFNPDPDLVSAASQAYCADPSAQNLIRLVHVTEPQRQELLRRINRAPSGTSALIGMREALLAQLKTQPNWAAIDSDMHHLLSSWFNPGFLELHEITWNSPAQLLEKIIRHEAVHAINGWDELRRRLQPDRRCFAFFHRQLPNEPLIFVEVALIPAIANNISVLIDKNAPVGEAKHFKTAIFYSISNCQPGLRGVSLGNFLIKRVAEKLIEEIPTLKTFCTLSPIPGFKKWLDSGALVSDNADLSAGAKRKIQTALEMVKNANSSMASGGDSLVSDRERQDAHMRLCAVYLKHVSATPTGDAVAKFHLTNGATLHQIHWGADNSKKGLQQSEGMMVNYLYDLNKVEAQHEAFSLGQVAHASGLNKWL